MNSDNRQSGYTLVELIVVIVIIAILGVFASSRLANQDNFSARGYYDELVSAARFAQRYAVASGCAVDFTIAADSSYALVIAAPCTSGVGNPVMKPAGGSFSGSAPAAVTATADTFTYDAHGDVDAGGVVTVNGGGTPLSFTIVNVSGYVDLP